MPFVKAESDDIYYVEVAGSAHDSPVIVWAHGFLLSGAFYKEVIGLLPAYRHVVVDHRGHGQSSSVATEGTTARMSDDILAVVAALGIARFVYVGHSMGAAIGWRVAAKAPRAVVAGISIAGIPLNGKLAESHEWVLTMTDMAGDAAAMTEMITPLFRHVDARNAWATVAGASGAGVPRSIIRDIVTTQFHLDESGDLAPLVTQPWLFIVPSEDIAEPAWYQIENASRLSGAQVEVLEGEGHLVPQERPVLVATKIASFLAGLKV
jgi:pimeloyl-ACP methyl ester carboxylesterase